MRDDPTGQLDWTRRFLPDYCQIPSFCDVESAMSRGVDSLPLAKPDSKVTTRGYAVIARGTLSERRLLVVLTEGGDLCSLNKGI